MAFSAIGKYLKELAASKKEKRNNEIQIKQANMTPISVTVIKH